MKPLGRSIWDGDFAPILLVRALWSYLWSVRSAPVGANVGFASALWSVATRYSKWPMRPIGGLLVIVSIWAAKESLEGHEGAEMTFDQVETVASILGKAPSKLGGSSIRAINLLVYALEQLEPGSLHSKVLAFCELGGFYDQEGYVGKAWQYMDSAYSLAPLISDHNPQKARVLEKLALFYDKYGKPGAKELAVKAMEIAERTSPDQERKLRRELTKFFRN